MSAVETSSARNLPSLWRERVAWLLLAVYLALVVRYAWNPTPFAELLAAIGIASALAHCTLTYGWKNTLAFVAICLVVTFALENFGSLTGALFGRYHFEIGAQLPHVGVIPIIVGPLWFGMGYFAWIVAGTLLGGADRNLNRQLNILAQPVVAAFVMTQWDFVMDAPTSTISRAWIWLDGGADFGVPLTNYVGWLFDVVDILSVICALPRQQRSGPSCQPKPCASPCCDPVLRVFGAHPSDAMADGAERRGC